MEYRLCSQKQCQSNTNVQKNTNQQRLNTINQNKPYIGSLNECPQFMKDFKLLNGYRINFTSYKQVLKSLFLIHNQTVNIWSHFAGAIIMIIIIFSVFQYQTRNDSKIIKFENLIRKYDFQNIHCNAQAENLVQETLIPKKIKQKIMKNETCHPHGQKYFGDFVCQIAVDEINLIKNYVLSHFGQNLKKLQKMKLHWELQVIPNIVHQIQKQSNFDALNIIKNKIQQFKIRLDENQYEYLDLGEPLDNPQKVSRFPLIIFLLCATFCLTCSSIFHIFNSMSSKAYQISIGLDMAGINIFLSGSVFPTFYYGMYCYFNVAYFYMIVIMLIGSTLFTLSLTDWFKKTQNFVLRSVCYGGFGFFLTFPVIHLVINQIFFDNYGDKFSFLPSIHWFVLSALSFLSGLIVYTKRCPDRDNTGKYDLCGHSHQTWHCLVLLGMFFLYFGSCSIYETRKQSICPVQF